MGRRRTINFDLPPRMARKGASYYYVCNGPSRRWIPLGSDLARAKRRWAELDGGAPASLSVGDLVLRYIDREDRSASTTAQYRSYQRTLDAAFPIPASQLRSQHVALWRELNGSRKTYANGCIALLTASFRFGNELGLCETISVRRWELKGRDRDLLPGEFRAIRAASPDWLQIAMDLCYLTGSRPGDVRSLRWSQVTPEGVQMRQQKTGQRMVFSMTDDLASVLERARQRRIVGLFVVATERGRPVTRGQMDYAWHQACAAAGVEDAQFRDIRAMAAKQAKEDGLDFQALLGHTSLRMSERYLKGRQTVKAEPVRKKL